MALLELKGVRKAYGTTEVLGGIDLSIEKGEFVSIVGFSGSGKTTLLSILAGLLQPDSGSVLLNGVPVHEPGRERAVVFQNYSLLPWMTVDENVALGVDQAFSDWPAERRRAHVEKYVAMVKLTAARNKKPHELSGGMRQRVAVARALAMRPKVLLMDEPFAALDVQTRARMQDFLLDVWRDSGASVLFVTHHIDEAVALADRVVVFTSRPGRIKTIMPIDLPRPRNLFSREAEALRIQLTDLLRDEVDRAFAEQEALASAL